MSSKGPLLAGICGLCAPIVGLSMVGIAISRAPWFSWTQNALSDLGVGPTAPIFNSGLIAAGIIAAVFVVGIGKFLIGGRMGALCSIAMLWACSSLVLIGIFPEDAPGRIHYTVSVSFFVSLPISMLILALAMLVREGRRNLPAAAATVLLAVVAGAAWALPHDGVAIPEMISSLSGSAWFVLFSAKLVGRARGNE